MDYGKKWRLISISDEQDAFTNMAVDEAIARAVSPTRRTGASPVPTNKYGAVPTMRIYTWEPSSVSIGYFQKISDVVNSIGLNGTDNNYNIVRRPTGGTAVMHDGGPSFSLTLKDDLRTPSTRINITEVYSMLGRCVVEALRRLDVPADIWNGPRGNSNYFSLCTSSLCPYDVVSNGRKVAGYAARRLRGTTLLQGYISLPDGLTTRELRDAMIAAVEGVTGVRLLNGTLTEEERTLAVKLRDKKYTRREWNYKR